LPQGIAPDQIPAEMTIDAGFDSLIINIPFYTPASSPRPARRCAP
jgi:hypothetical protein